MVNIKPRRNAPCTCGSGKKYKKCCLEKHEGAVHKNSAGGISPTSAECQQLVVLFKAGYLAELESHARFLLDQYADSGFIWNILGASLQMQSKDGLYALQNAAKFSPNDHIVHSNLGNTLSKLGRLQEAADSYRRALKIKPDYAEAHYNLGNTQKNLGLFEDEIKSYRRALEINPNYAEAHNSLGNALQAQGQLDGAIASYRRAIEINPNLALVHNNFGNILKDLGQFDLAQVSYRRALEIKPDYHEARSNMLLACNFLNQSPTQMLCEARCYGELVARQAHP
jgi:tetratricopeptide (TPR) repeat protein